jgi:hypothetical protein
MSEVRKGQRGLSQWMREKGEVFRRERKKNGAYYLWVIQPPLCVRAVLQHSNILLCSEKISLIKYKIIIFYGGTLHRIKIRMVETTKFMCFFSEISLPHSSKWTKNIIALWNLKICCAFNNICNIYLGMIMKQWNIYSINVVSPSHYNLIFLFSFCLCAGTHISWVHLSFYISNLLTW